MPSILNKLITLSISFLFGKVGIIGHLGVVEIKLMDDIIVITNYVTIYPAISPC